MGKGLAAVAAAIAGLGLGGGAWAQDVCQQVVGQAEIGGIMQTIAGVACLQPDGTWQMVDSGGGDVAYGSGGYYYDPWYWTPYVGYGVIFIDHFHHHHVMHHVVFPNRGMIARGGFVHGGFHGGFHGGGAPGGFHGGGAPGGFHGGGGGMHR